MKTSRVVIGVRLTGLWLACATLLLATGAALAAPSVTVTSPKNNTRTTNGTITFTGAAAAGSTNDSLSQVELQDNGGDILTADGTSNWTATVTLSPGTNIIVVRSVNQSGAESTTVTRNVTYAFPTPLTIITNGPGSVVLTPNNTNVMLGATVRLRAIPAQNAVFVDWSGATNSTNPNITFVMTTNATLTATFAIQPITLVTGSYNGLVLNSSPTFANSGFFTLTVNRNSSFSGRLQDGGRTFPLSGRFDTNGRAEIFPKQSGATLDVVFQLDFSNQTDQVTGTVTLPDSTVSPLLGDRAVFDGRTNLSPNAGNYNVLIRSDDAMGGDGVLTLTVSGAGLAAISGHLADNTSFSQSVPVSKTGAWPLFASLYKNQGAIIGWLTFTNLPDTSVFGTVDWFKPPTTVNGFTNGIATNMDVIGSLVISPPSGVPLLNWTNGVVVLSGDDFMMPLTNMVTVRSNNTIQTTFQLNSMKLTSDNRGQLRGAFVNPVTQRSDTLAGVLLPKTNWGGGFFLDTNGAGMLYVAQDITDTNTVITPPTNLIGATLTITPTAKTQTGAFRTLGETSFTFTSTNLTSSSSSFGTGTYLYSSQPSAGVVNVVELNINESSLGARPAIIQMLLNFMDDTTGTYLASVTGGGAGLSSGTFTVTPPTTTTTTSTP